MNNIRPETNSAQYWEQRFQTGDWEKKRGRTQTHAFARCFVPHLRMAHTFAGRILDFGCALGDALPVYRTAFPQAQLLGMDISQAAVDACRRRYDALATFVQGDYRAAPEAEVIIVSNVMEHLANYRDIALELQRRCRQLYVVVPYREVLTPGTEHVNTFDEHAFDWLGTIECHTFPAHEWSEYRANLWINVYLKNLLRPFFGRPFRRRNRLIVFRIGGILGGLQEGREPPRVHH